MKLTIEDVKVYIATILTTLKECEGHWSPKVSFYLIFGSDLHKYQTIEQLMVKSGMVTVTSEIMTLTPVGLELATKAQEAIDKMNRQRSTGEAT